MKMFLATLTALATATALSAEVPLGDEALRPQIHYTPKRNWMNDPNGLIKVGDEYHLFYQYNPEGIRWGHMTWGHAVSIDLLHWRELPVAIPEDARDMVFSGSVVLDTANSSGFGSPGKPAMVAIYTGAAQPPAKRQRQNIAFSTDQGRTWTKYAGNPVLDLGLEDFRDPKVFWYEPTHSWIMAAALSTQKKVAFFRSPDLKTWTHLSDFGPAGASDGVWECPDLFPMPVANRPGEVRWVLKVDAQFSKIAPGGGGQFFVGSFDGERFTPGADSQPIWADYGPDFYASAFWSGIPAADGRRILLGWMDNWTYGQDLPTSPWRGVMSLPRELSLHALAHGYEIRQAPIRELASLTTTSRRSGPPAGRTGSVDVATLSSPGLPHDVTVEWQADDAAQFGLHLRSANRTEATIRYDAAKHLLWIDRAPLSDPKLSTAFAHSSNAPVALENGRLKLRLVLDRGSIELFAQDGARVLTEQLMPVAPITSLSTFADGGAAKLLSMDVATLASAREK